MKCIKIKCIYDYKNNKYLPVFVKVNKDFFLLQVMFCSRSFLLFNRLISNLIIIKYDMLTEQYFATVVATNFNTKSEKNN